MLAQLNLKISEFVVCKLYLIKLFFKDCIAPPPHTHTSEEHMDYLINSGRVTGYPYEKKKLVPYLITPDTHTISTGLKT